MRFGRRDEDGQEDRWREVPRRERLDVLFQFLGSEFFYCCWTLVLIFAVLRMRFDRRDEAAEDRGRGFLRQDRLDVLFQFLGSEFSYCCRILVLIFAVLRMRFDRRYEDADDRGRGLPRNLGAPHGREDRLDVSLRTLES